MGPNRVDILKIAELGVHVVAVEAHQRADTGTVIVVRVFARAPLALSSRGTIVTSRRRETKSAWRSPSACPIRIPLSASNANRNRSRNLTQAARIDVISSTVRLPGNRRGALSLTGRVGIGGPR